MKRKDRSAETMRLKAEVRRLKALLAKAKSRVQRLEQQADIDPLVPVYNRRAFMRLAERVRLYCKRYESKAAIVYLDISGFKHVNDTHGHAAGDTVLKHLASILEDSIRSSDYLGRLGGDEFGVVLQQVDAGQAGRIAQRLVDTIAKTAIPVGGSEIHIAVSAGVASLNEAEEAQAALDHADRAMYAARASAGVRDFRQ